MSEDRMLQDPVPEDRRPEHRRPLRVLAFAGSLRTHSYNRRLLEAAADAAPPGIVVTLHDTLADVPLFDEDVEARIAGGPDGVRNLRAAIAAADGVLIATPEYNQSMPGVLKNTLDWLSREEEGQPSVLAGKPVALMGVTAGRWGTRLAQAQVRHALAAMEALAMPAPQLYLADAAGSCDAASGRFDAATAARLQDFLAAFMAWIRLLQGDHPLA